MTQRTTQVTNDTDVALVTTAETVVATLEGTATNRPGQTLSFRASARIESGADSTHITLRVRRDSVTGTSVGDPLAQEIVGAVGDVATYAYDCQDVNPGEFSGRTYVLTAEQTAASANGESSTATLECAYS